MHISKRAPLYIASALIVVLQIFMNCSDNFQGINRTSTPLSLHVDQDRYDTEATSPASSTPPWFTVCEYGWDKMVSQNGWLTRTWQPQDCSHGLPQAGWISLGQGLNSNGTQGQVTCSLSSGASYGHATVNGATHQTVRCLYADAQGLQSRHPQKRAPLTACSYSWSAAATGWRETKWTSSDCSNGLPSASSESIGQSSNGNGTIGQIDCRKDGASHFNHSSISSATSGRANCLYIDTEALKAALPQTTKPATLCRAKFSEHATGWRSKIWTSSDCSSQLPPPTALSLGATTNGNGSPSQGLCSTSTGYHYNNDWLTGATSGGLNCLYLDQGSVRMSATSTAAQYTHDLDGNGENDTRFSLQTCSGDKNQYCLTVQASMFFPAREISLGVATAPMNSTLTYGGKELQFVGDHFGTGYAEAAILHLTSGHPTLSIIDLAAGSVVASSRTPQNVTAAYVDYARGPGNKLYPFLAPPYGDALVASGYTVPWGRMCLFRPGSAGSGSCGAHFSEINIQVSDSYSSDYFRESGGYLQDIDGDGWQDIHLIYHSRVVAFSAKTGERLNSLYYDQALATEPYSPALFHSGRNYGIHTAVTGSDGKLRTIQIAGVHVGSFTDSMCNVSNYVLALESTPGQPATRRLAWSNYFGFNSNIYSQIDSSLRGSPPISRRGNFLNNCIHRFGDGLSKMDSKEIIIFNYFKAQDSFNACAQEQYDLYLPPEWTEQKQATWNACLQNSLKRTGTWGMQVLDQQTGQTLTGSLGNYIWGMSNALTTDKEMVYIVESVSDGTRFDFSNRSVGTLSVLGLKNGAWKAYGTLPKAVRPDIVYASAGGHRGVGSSTSFAELNLSDIDKDGLMELKLTDGTWVGWDQKSGRFAVKTK